MRVLVFPADSTGCGLYRLAWPAQYLKHLGHDVEVCYMGQRGILQFDSLDGKSIHGIRMPRDVDVMVFQRVSSRMHAELFPELRRRGIAVVMDMDDDLGRIPKESSAWAAYNNNPVHDHANVLYAASQSTLVTVSTAALWKSYVKHGRGVVIDNYVRGSDLEVVHEDSEVFGWGGTTKTHATDLQTVGTAARDIQDLKYECVVVGPPSDVQAHLKLSSPPRYTGWVDTVDWTTALSQLGVGMAPLLPCIFNRAKSRLKVIEMSAVGVPWVASPLPEYQRFHQESCTGILASSPTEWFDGLKRLLESPSLRADMGEAGREHMKTQTIELNAWRWLEAWEHALKLERG